MSRKTPKIESVIQAVMIINTYCHYVPCKECIFKRNGENELIRHETELCFFTDGPSGWNVDDIALLGDLVEGLTGNVVFSTDTVTAKNKYKLVAFLLEDWHKNYRHLNFTFGYEDHVKENKNAYLERFFKLLMEEKNG